MNFHETTLNTLREIAPLAAHEALLEGYALTHSNPDAVRSESLCLEDLRSGGERSKATLQACVDKFKDAIKASGFLGTCTVEQHDERRPYLGRFVFQPTLE